MIKQFLQKNSEFLLWSDLKRMEKKDVLNKLIHFCPTNTKNVGEAQSILDELDQSEIVFSGHLLGQFVIVYFWLQSYNLNMLSISCTDIQSLKNVLWVYSQILSIQIEYVRLEKTRAQDPQLKNVRKEIQKIIQTRDNTKKSLMICIEEIKICSSVFPSLKELVGALQEREVIFILLKDEMNPYKSEDPLNEFYREDQIYLDNFQLKDYEEQNHKFVHHFVKSIISEEFKEFYEDIAMVIFKINIAKIISTSIIKPQSQRLLVLINQLCQHPQFFPSNEIASMIKKQQRQMAAYVQTYSKGKLELVIHSLILALHLTYSCVTKAGRFWDLVREIFNEDRHEAGQSTQFIKEFQSVIENSLFEQIIEKFQENISKKLLMLESPQNSAYTTNQHIYMTKSCIESISSIVISIIFKRPLLIIGHSGTSKTFCSRLVQESLNSLQAKDNLGIKKERNFRFINYQGTNDLSEDEIHKIIYKAEQQKKKNPSVEIIVAIDNFQISHKGQDYAQKLAQLELISKQQSFTIILISSNDELKLDGMLTPNLIQVKLHRIEKSDLMNISRKLFNPTIKYHDILIEQLVAWYKYNNFGQSHHINFNILNDYSRPLFLKRIETNL